MNRTKEQWAAARGIPQAAICDEAQQDIAELHARIEGLEADLTAAIEAEKSVEPVGYFYIDPDGSWRQAHDPEFLHIHTPLYLAPPAQPVAVPDGWKLVPIEPTEEMIDAYLYENDRYHSARSDWKAMLAAAPEVQP